MIYSDSIQAVSRAAVLENPTPLEVFDLQVTHGEQDLGDCISANLSFNTCLSDYASELAQWQSNYQSDIQAATGQSAPVIFLIDPEGANEQGVSNIYNGQSATQIAAWAQTLADPAHFKITTPKYPLALLSDYIHLNAHSQHLLGEYIAKAKAAANNGQTWVPVAPTALSVSSNVITVTFSFPPEVSGDQLVLDNTVWEGAYPNYGFEYAESSGSPPNWPPSGCAVTPTITSVALSGANQVEITMSAGPTAGCTHYLSYGLTPPGNPIPSGGNLRDNDPAMSGLGDGTHLYNWAVNFQCKFLDGDTACRSLP